MYEVKKSPHPITVIPHIFLELVELSLIASDEISGGGSEAWAMHRKFGLCMHCAPTRHKQIIWELCRTSLIRHYGDSTTVPTFSWVSPRKIENLTSVGP